MSERLKKYFWRLPCAECCGSAMIDSLPVDVGFSRCEELPAENDESVVTAFGVFEQETEPMNFRVGVESPVGNPVLPCGQPPSCCS